MSSERDFKSYLNSYVIPQVEIPSTDQAAGVDEGQDVEADTQDAEHRQYCVELYTGGGIGKLIVYPLGPFIRLQECFKPKKWKGGYSVNQNHSILNMSRFHTKIFWYLKL